MTQTFRHFVADQVDDITIVEFTDRELLDEDSILEIRDALARMVEVYQRVKLLLNFGQVQALSSSGLAMLIALDKLVVQAHGRLALNHLGPQILKLFEITKLEDRFEIFPTEQAALESL